MAALEILNASLAVTATITHPLAVTCTDRMSALGEMSFTVYEGSPGASAIVPAALIRWTDGAYSFLGIVENVGRARQDDGYVILSVRCSDIARELAWYSAGGQALGGPEGATITVTAAIAALLGLEGALAGWSIPTGGGVGALTLYLAADGASIFTMLLSIADKVGAWLVRTGGAARQLTMTSAWSASGITARPVSGDKPANVAALLALTSEEAAADLVTTVFPYTAGNAAVRIGLAQATAAPPAGYVRNWRTYGASERFYYVQDTAAVATYGARLRFVQFADISPLSNSHPDIVTAANALQTAAVNWLKQQARVQQLYTLTVDDSPAPIMPGQSLTVQQGALNATLYCVEAQHTWAPNAPLRSNLKVTDGARWPLSGADETVRSMEAARVYRAHAQLAPNVYQVAYNKPVDAQYAAEFRFRFDEAITQVLMVALDVQIGPLQSTVRALGAQGARTSLYTAPGHTHSFTADPHTHTTPAHQHSMTFAGHSHFGGVHTHSYTTIAHVHQITITKVSTGGSDFNDVRLNSSAPNNFQVTVGSGAGTTVTTPTESTGGASTETGNGGNVATSSGLIGTFNTNSGEGGGTTGSATVTGTVAAGGSFQHDHSVDVTVTMEYGIYRDTAANTYALADLEYAINGGAWADLSTAASLGDGWYRLALTNALIDLTSFYPLSKSNRVAIRAKQAGTQEETFAVMGTGAVQVWNDGGANVASIAGTNPTAIAMSANRWIYKVIKSTGAVEGWQPSGPNSWSIWDTWIGNLNAYNAICVDQRTGKKWVAGDSSTYVQAWSGLSGVLSPGGTISWMAAFNDWLYFSLTNNTLIRAARENWSQVTISSVAVAPIAALSDGRIVQLSSMAAAFALVIRGADLSGPVTVTRSDTGNAWAPLSMASAGNIVHVGCSDGRVRSYSLEGTLLWTSTGTPGATGYPSTINRLAVTSQLSPKAAAIDAQLTVRSVVQAIVMN